MTPVVASVPARRSARNQRGAGSARNNHNPASANAPTHSMEKKANCAACACRSTSHSEEASDDAAVVQQQVYMCGGHHRSVPVSERSCIDVVPAQKRLDS
jgi:hypothetical protein